MSCEESSEIDNKWLSFSVVYKTYAVNPICVCCNELQCIVLCCGDAHWQRTCMQANNSHDENRSHRINSPESPDLN